MAYSNRSNATRAAKKAAPAGNYEVVQLATGGFDFVVTGTPPELVQAPWPFPKAADIAVPYVWPAVVAKVRAASTRVLREVRNGVRKPLKGVCADLWAAFSAMTEPVEVADVKAYALANGLNANNATQEFYAWRKFYA
jgi:hypothetical protein